MVSIFQSEYEAETVVVMVRIWIDGYWIETVVFLHVALALRLYYRLYVKRSKNDTPAKQRERAKPWEVAIAGVRAYCGGTIH